MAPKMEGKEMNIASSNEESKHTKKRRKNSTLDGNYIENNIRMTNSFIPTLRVFSFPSIYVQYALLLLKTADNWSPKVIISRFRSLLRVECAWAFSRNHFRTVKKKSAEQNIWMEILSKRKKRTKILGKKSDLEFGLPDNNHFKWIAGILAKENFCRNGNWAWCRWRWRWRRWFL